MTGKVLFFSSFFLLFFSIVYFFSLHHIYPFSSISLFFCLPCFLISPPIPNPPPPCYLLSLSHFLNPFFPLCSPFYAFLLPLTPFSLSNPICWIFDQLRQQEETNSHFIIHTFSSSPAICPSTKSDPARKVELPRFNNMNERTQT